MVRFAIAEVLRVNHVRALGFDSAPMAEVKGVSTDSRTTQAGDVFVAIRGEKLDGHDFVTRAIGMGAGAVFVDRKWADSNGAMLVSLNVPRLVVEDTTKALGELASWYRRKFSIPVIAVAGSNGKTTTKNMISAVLATKYRVLGTEGNLNNQIGVPQTLFRLTGDYEVAVVEIGTNHFGEIAYLCSVLLPTHGIITNIGREHLEFFGSTEGVAKAEGELVDWLRQNKGIFFANKDDKYIASRIRRVRMRKTVSFGFQARMTDVKGTLGKLDNRGCAKIKIRPGRKKPYEVRLNVPGMTNAENALAAATVGFSLNVPAKDVTKALENFSAAGKRMEVIRLKGLTILNDTYNANPDSTIAALSTLRATQAVGRRIAILADMLELGKSAEKEHMNVGKAVTANRIDCLFTYGTLARSISEVARVNVKQHFDDKSALAEHTARFVASGDLVLVKGSRGMKMEEIVSVLQQKFA